MRAGDEQGHAHELQTAVKEHLKGLHLAQQHCQQSVHRLTQESSYGCVRTAPFAPSHCSGRLACPCLTSLQRRVTCSSCSTLHAKANTLRCC